MDLDHLRRDIDQLDAEIVELLNRRARVVVKVGKLKANDGSPIYVPQREREVLDRITADNKGPLPDKTLRAIWRELMSGSFALEKPLRIAYLGPEGSYSHLAATGKFGASVEYESLSNIAGVFDEVAREHADFGLVPIENTTGGGVIDTLDAFVQTDVKIYAEINLAVHHNLLANCRLEQVAKVYSKPEVFSQCQQWLASVGLAEKTMAVASTSKAAELASSESDAAAIGSTLAAELYGLKIVCTNIEDNPNNVTRFFVIARQWAKPSSDDKTALMFTTAHRAGALALVLDVFNDQQVNLTFITSRPSKKRNWEYYFFVDAEGHIEEEGMSTAVERAREHCLDLHVLGSFARASEVL